MLQTRTHRLQASRQLTQVDRLRNLAAVPLIYLGPVLPADYSSTSQMIGNVPRAWVADQVYLTGDRASDHGYVFQARWWTQGEEPQVHPIRPQDAAWVIVRRIKKPSGAVTGRPNASP